MSNPRDPPTAQPASSNKPAAVWQDRRGMFQRGKEVHEPGMRRMSQTGPGIIGAVRRASNASSSNGSLVDKPLGDDPADPGYYPTASDSRRRRVSSRHLIRPVRAAQLTENFSSLPLPRPRCSEASRNTSAAVKTMRHVGPANLSS